MAKLIRNIFFPSRRLIFLLEFGLRTFAVMSAVEDRDF